MVALNLMALHRPWGIALGHRPGASPWGIAPRATPLGIFLNIYSLERNSDD